MTSNESFDFDEDDEIEYGPSKSQRKRDSHHLQDVGEEILKLNPQDRKLLNLPEKLEEAINVALKIRSGSGLKRQRQYIGKLIRSMDHDDIEQQLRQIQHRHDTNTARFHRLEKWRDGLVENDKAIMNEVIKAFPDIDRQHLNQLIRQAAREARENKPPAASRKLFKYLRDFEEPQA
jgi:ribosome-associated protein